MIRNFGFGLAVVLFVGWMCLAAFAAGGEGDAFSERDPQKRVNVVIEAKPTHWLQYAMWGSGAAASLVAAGFGLWKWRKARRAKAACDHP